MRMNPNHGGFVKAQQIGRIAKENGWHGSIEEDAVTNETILYAYRNGPEFDFADETVTLTWKGNALVERPEYSLLGRTVYLQSQHQILDKIRDYPDVTKIVKKFHNRPDIVELVERYRRLPFDPLADSNEIIMSAVVGRKIWWYNRMDGNVRDGFVVSPKRKSQVFEIRPVGHRRLLNFVDRDTGMRAVLLDQLLKVEQ